MTLAEDTMTTPRLLATTLLALLIVSACAPRDPPRGSAGVDDRAGASAGVTVFGDARIGVVRD